MDLLVMEDELIFCIPLHRPTQRTKRGQDACYLGLVSTRVIPSLPVAISIAVIFITTAIEPERAAVNRDGLGQRWGGDGLQSGVVLMEVGRR